MNEKIAWLYSFNHEWWGWVLFSTLHKWWIMKSTFIRIYQKKEGKWLRRMIKCDVIVTSSLFFQQQQQPIANWFQTNMLKISSTLWFRWTCFPRRTLRISPLRSPNAIPLTLCQRNKKVLENRTNPAAVQYVLWY